MLDEGYWGGDNNYGEMFYNFWLHPELQRYSRVDLSAHFLEELVASGKGVLWEAWTQPAMGLRPSPYQAVQGVLVVKRMALGDPDDSSNLFQWDQIVLNLPGNEDYMAGAPWVLKR
jgi:hypothetical protein